MKRINSRHVLIILLIILITAVATVIIMPAVVSGEGPFAEGGTFRHQAVKQQHPAINNYTQERTTVPAVVSTGEIETIQTSSLSANIILLFIPIIALILLRASRETGP